MPSGRPSFVFILADDMGYGDLGAFGNPDVRTPNLDRLASEGVRLTHHYSASPVCAPARAALLTGRYPHRTGAIDTLEGRGLDRLALAEVTVADVLKASGYATGIVGKWHNGALDPRYHPNARGFDEFAGFRGGWQDYYHWRLDRNGTVSPADGRYLTDVFADEACSFITRHAGGPFALLVTFNAPHFPLQVPDAFAEQFRGAPGRTRAVADIYGMNLAMDSGVGRILETLERRGLVEDTLVIFTSDNGPQFGGKGEGRTDRPNAFMNGAKGSVLEGGIRVPAIVRWPGGVPGGGRESAEFVHFTDWMPTLLEAAGAAPPRGRKLDGTSALAALRGEESRRDPVRFWQWNRYTPLVTSNAAMREGEWKLVRPAIAESMRISGEDGVVDRALKYEPESITDITRGPEPEREVPEPGEPVLFDIAADPGETRDVAADHPSRVASMLRELERWFGEVDAERRAIRD